MTARTFSNIAVVTTISVLTNIATTGTLAANTGWSAASCTAVIEPGTANAEVVLITARSGNSITAMTRGYDGTTAVAHAANSVIAQEISAIDLSEANAHVNLSAQVTTGVHGIVGFGVGDSQTQTLTNKTMSGASNTFSAVPTTALADFVAAPAVTLNAWTNMTLTNSWVVSTALADSPTTAAYWVSPTGWVSFRGLIKSGTAGAAAFTMPAALRSTFSRIFICHANSGSDTQGRVILGSDGTLKPTLTWTNQLSLDNICYQVG